MVFTTCVTQLKLRKEPVMICIRPIMNLRNSNLSTKRTNNNKQNRFNSVSADSVSFGNTIPRPQQLADVFQTLVGQVRANPKTVDKVLLGGFMQDVATFTRKNIQTAEENFTRDFPEPEMAFLDEFETVVTRRGRVPTDNELPLLNYRITSPLRDTKYPRGTYLLITDNIDASHLEKKVYEPEAPQIIRAKIMQKSRFARCGEEPWTVTNAGVMIPPKPQSATFCSYESSHYDDITLD